MNLTHERYNEANHAFLNVVDHYGLSQYTSMPPELVLIYDRKNPRMGELSEEDEVIINFAQCTTWKQVIITMVHEYVHYLQPRNWYNRHFDNGHTYKSHPYEKEADRISLRDYSLFID